MYGCQRVTSVIALFVAVSIGYAHQHEPQGQSHVEVFSKKHAHIYASAVNRSGKILVTAGQDPSLLVWYSFDFRAPKDPVAMRLSLTLR
jgi:hypothetical protein